MKFSTLAFNLSFLPSVAQFSEGIFHIEVDLMFVLFHKEGTKGFLSFQLYIERIEKEHYVTKMTAVVT